MVVARESCQDVQDVIQVNDARRRCLESTVALSQEIALTMTLTP